jgi:hypothetical protein
MDNTQSQIIANFKSLFGQYKAVVTENDKQLQINVGTKTTTVNKVRSVTQSTTTRL